MTDTGTSVKPAASPASKDLTGMDRMAWNVITSWGGHLVFVVAGFVLPRMIDQHVGQVSLGIWDFSWSLVSYFGLASLGVGSSVNRYVAMYRASGEIDKMRRAVSSVVALQVCIALFVMVLTAAVVPLIPILFSERIGSQILLARWIVGLLGFGLAIQMGFDAFRGIMTGCHRWDVHNGLNSGSYAITTVAMIAALMLGGTLREVSAVYVILGLITEIIRTWLALRLCPELQIRMRYVNRADMRRMLKFGGNSVIVGLVPLLLGQATNLLVAHSLGPAALAVFSRPVGLVRSVQTFLNKFAYVLTPTAGSLQGAGRSDEIRNLVRQTTRIGVALSLPMILMLVINGDLILRLWMGERYDNPAVLTILALGSFLPMTQQSVMTILIGLNLHGKIGPISLILSVVGLIAGVVLVNFTGWSLVASALLVAIPLTIANGVALVWFVCRQLQISKWGYLRHSFGAPLACAIPYVAVLYAVRWLAPQSPVLVLLLGAIAGGAVLGPLYCVYILPEQIRSKLRQRIPQGPYFGFLRVLVEER